MNKKGRSREEKKKGRRKREEKLGRDMGKLQARNWGGYDYNTLYICVKLLKDNYLYI